MVGFTAGVLVVAMTGSAFACTYFYGKLTVSATDPETGLVSSAFADGPGGYSADPLAEGGLHGSCPVPAPVDNTTDGAVSEARPAQGFFKADVFTVQVGRTTTCLTQTSLADAPAATDGDYVVRWLNLKDAQSSRLCLSDRNDSVVKEVGVITIIGGVAGPTSFSQGPSSAGDEVKVCVNKATTGLYDYTPPEVKILMI